MLITFQQGSLKLLTWNKMFDIYKTKPNKLFSEAYSCNLFEVCLKFFLLSFNRIFWTIRCKNRIDTKETELPRLPRLLKRKKTRGMFCCNHGEKTKAKTFHILSLSHLDIVKPTLTHKHLICGASAINLVQTQTEH